MDDTLINIQAKHDVLKLVYGAVTFLPNTTQAELFFMEGGIAALEDSIETIKGEGNGHI